MWFNSVYALYLALDTKYQCIVFCLMLPWQQESLCGRTTFIKMIYIFLCHFENILDISFILCGYYAQKGQLSLDHLCKET